VVWLPPAINQLTGSPRNVSVIFDHLGDPPEAPIGLRAGIELLLRNLNPWRWVPHLVPDSWVLGSSLRPGAVLLAVWTTAAVAAWRVRHVALVRLNLVLGAALVLATVSMSRIFGFVWFYLVLWAWGIGVLMLLAVGWTAGVLVGRRLRGAIRERATTAVTAALAGVSALVIFLATVDAAYVQPPAPELSAMMGELAPPTVEALDGGSVPGSGRDGRYLVTWDDPIALGSLGFGLLLELERAGFDVGALEVHRAGATPQRVLDPAEATAEVHVALGSDIEAWRDRPGARQVAHVDPRSRRDRAEYARLRGEIVDELAAAGLDDLARGVDENLFNTSLDPRVPEGARLRMMRMLSLGLPAAVFVAPPGSIG